MPIQRLIQSCRLILALVAIAGSGVAFAADQRPNIIFIFSDDHASHAIGAYRGWLQDVAPTPHINQLARDGMLFENSFCTNSLCGPSRAVILTGKHSHLNGFRDNRDRFDGAQQTFPKLLQQAGYQTAVIGKWHLVSDPTGFDHWEILPGQGAYYNPEFISVAGRTKEIGYCTDLVTDKAVAWLAEKRDPQKPFVLMCQHKAPHRNWMPPERYLTLYDDVELPEPETLFDDYQDNASPARAQEMEIARHLHLVNDLHLRADQVPPGYELSSLDREAAGYLKRMTPEQRAAWNAAYDPKNLAFQRANPQGDDLVRWKYQRYAKDYLRCVKTVDDSVGVIRDTLNRLGLAENTIVIYSSDQGFYVGDHGWYDKRWMYEESLKMPLIVAWPGVTKPGVREVRMVQNLDYAPTFLEAAGLSIPSDMQGASLIPLLRGDDVQNWRKSIYYHYYELPGYHMVAKQYGVRTEREKLIHFYATDEWEYYDLHADPDELHNGYNDPANAERIASLKTELANLRQRYRDE
ncbi:MAG: sulfatase [Planctomycetales bacterium]|nr:sulfatase [Planctomycetales bacterium]